MRVNGAQYKRGNGDAQGCQGINSNDIGARLVYDTKHRDYVNVFRLTHEFREDSNIIDHPLGICEPHRAIQEVEDVFLSRVIETYTGTPNSVSASDVQ